MNKLSTLQLDNVHKLKAENERLKDLIEQLYDMSCLDDMINDLRAGEDDEMLLCNLMLKSDIMWALEKEEKPKTAEILKPFMIEDAVKPKHNGSETSKHYVEDK